MNIILDTNVFISGIFFSGPPFQIINAWRNGKFGIVLSEDIFIEYQRVSQELSKQFKGVDISTFLDLLTINAIWVDAPELPFSVSADPDDDKFLACAMIVSGDKHLLTVSGYRNIEIIKPSLFIAQHL